MNPKSKIWSLESGVSQDTNSRLKALADAPKALWSAVTCHRFFRLADLSAKQRRVQRRAEIPEPTFRFELGRLTAFDGDKSPHSKGFAASLAARFFERAPRLQTRDFRHQA